MKTVKLLFCTIAWLVASEGLYAQPTAPKNLKAIAGDRQITLIWDANTESDFLRYCIYRGTSPNPTTKVDSTNGAANTTKTLAGLTNGTTYYFRITAVDNALQKSAFSNEVNATPSLFIEVNAPLTGVTNGTVAWGDYDNDDDLDILLTGYIGTFNTISKIYRNDAESFVDINANWVGAASGSAWSDYDNDGDLDVLLTGNSAPKLYRNDGENFVEDTRANLGGIKASSAAWGDYNNDGTLDLALTGYTGNPPVATILSAIYRNVKGAFFYDFESNLGGVYEGSIAWGDYDNDRDLDFLLTGNTSVMVGASFSSLYKNRSGVLLKDSTNNLISVSSSSVAWGDYDNDGDLDILLTGGHYIPGTSSSLQAEVYGNDGGRFNQRYLPDLKGVTQSAAAWGDYDNDGNPDILLTGNETPGPVAKVYRNTGNGFTAVSAGLVGGRDGAVAWGDYDNDGDLDILMIGMDALSNRMAKIYRNESVVSNTPPTPPTNLTSALTSDTVILNWDKATDKQTPSNGLTYNLRIGVTPSGAQIVSPMSNASNGFRKLPQLGNTNLNNSWFIKNLAPGTYYWSVQAIDNAFAGSAFAPEQSFVVGDTVVTLAIHDTSAAPSDTVQIPIKITDAKGIAGAALAVTYNKNILTALGAQTTALTSGFTIDDSVYASGKIAISLARATGIAGGSGDFVNLKFKVNLTANIGDTTRLSFTKSLLYDENTKEISATAVNGVFTVAGIKSIQILPDSAVFFVKLGGKQIFQAKGLDVNNKPVAVNPDWSVNPVGLGSFNPTKGENTTFTAQSLGDGSVKAQLGVIFKTANVTVGLLGDISKDFIVDVRDAIIALRMIAGLDLPPTPPGHKIPTAYEKWAADFNEDKVINAADALLILSKSLDRLHPAPKVIASNEEAVVRVPRLEARVGETVALPVFVEKRTDVYAADLILSYDPGALTLLAVAPGDSNSLMAANTQEPGKIKLAMVNLDRIVGPKGELVRLKLRVEKMHENGAALSVENVNLFDVQAKAIQVQVVTGVTEEIALPQSYNLFQNYPNPFNPETVIHYQLPKESAVKLQIYNLHGQLVRTLVDAKMKAGEATTTWNGRDALGSIVPSGIYFYRLSVNGGEWMSTRKMIMMR